MYSKTSWIGILALLTASPLAAQTIQRLHPGGIIAGRVETDGGKPLMGVDVAVVRIPIPDILRTGSPVASSRTVAGGTFQVSGLPQGSYRLCPQLAFSEYLDPCEWSTSNTVVSIGSNGVSRGNVIRMEAGHVMKVRVDDPQELLDKNLKSLRGSSLMIGYQHRTKPFAVKAPSSVTKNSREYVFAVPYDTAELRIGVLSRRFSVEDANSRVLAATHEIPIAPVRKGAAPTAAFVVRVKGVN